MPASSLSVVLGVHDRSKEREPHRSESSFNARFFFILAFFCRKHIRVSKVVVHEDFSTHVNDIALLKLGEFFFKHICEKFDLKTSKFYLSLPFECLINH